MVEQNEFFELTPSEIAVFWLSTDPNPKETDKVKFLCSPSTLILGILLAEGFSAAKGNISEESVFSAIKEYSSEMAQSLSAGNFYVRHDFPVRNLLWHLKDAGLPLVSPQENASEQDRDPVSRSYEYGSRALKDAIYSLEARDLIVDPPWYKSKLAAGALIILLGSIPMEINIKTEKGAKICQTLSIKSWLWEYESIESPQIHDQHLNLKIVKFIDNCIYKLGHNFISSWNECNPERVHKIKRKPSE